MASYVTKSLVQRNSSMIRRRPQHNNMIEFHRTTRQYHTTLHRALAMKPGTPIPGLDIYKEKDPVVALNRSEYPEWVNQLATPLPTLSELRKLSEVEMSEKEKMRFLKLTRRIQIKAKHAEMAALKK